jgi:hypothetical protein
MSSIKEERARELAGYISKILRVVGQADISPSSSVYHYRGGDKYPFILRACMGPVSFEYETNGLIRKKNSYMIEVLSLGVKQCWFRLRMFPKVKGGYRYRVDTLLEGPWIEQLMDLNKQVLILQTTKDLMTIK